MTQHVRFTRDIWEDADDYAPAGTWAWKGEIAEVVDRASGDWELYVRLNNGTVIGCYKTEVEPA